MKKAILLFAVLLMGGSGFLGALNYRALQDEVAQLEKALGEIKEVTSDLRAKEDERDDAIAKMKTAQDERDQGAASLSEAQQTLMRQQSQIENGKKELMDIETQQKEYQLIFDKLDGITSLDDLKERETGLNEQLAAHKEQIANYTSQLNTFQEDVVTAETQVRAAETRQIKYAQRLALNGLEATVVAVNKDWGFVMVNIGKNLGIEPSQSLLIKRGDERLARLRIVDIQDSLLVADVVPGTLAEGARVSPGDKVILENTN